MMVMEVATSCCMVPAARHRSCHAGRRALLWQVLLLSKWTLRAAPRQGLTVMLLNTSSRCCDVDVVCVCVFPCVFTCHSCLTRGRDRCLTTGVSCYMNQT